MNALRIAAMLALALASAGCLCIETLDLHVRRDGGSPAYVARFVYRHIESDATADSGRAADFEQLLGNLAPDEAKGEGGKPPGWSSRGAHLSVEHGVLVGTAEYRADDWAALCAGVGRELGGVLSCRGDTLFAEGDAGSFAAKGGVPMPAERGKLRRAWTDGARAVDLTQRDESFHPALPGDFVKRYRAWKRAQH
jgi:hypothetical protein